MSVATLAELRGVTPWLWVICERCLHRVSTALAPWIIRWGADASSNMLRRSARCTRCGGKGNDPDFRMGWVADARARVADCLAVGVNPDSVCVATSAHSLEPTAIFHLP